MSKREKLEKSIAECWLAYDQSVALKDMQAAHEYRLDICLCLACLLNTCLDADATLDWRGIWADRLLDAELDTESSCLRRARGLMVCGKLTDSYMHLTPFRGEFVFSTDFQTLKKYELRFAAEGPWDRPGTPFVVPFTKDENVRQELMNRLGPGDNWATVYHWEEKVPGVE
jgi:hypothetical protein